jgi:hypothetical protein
MATRILQAEVLENNCFIELEAEETMQFKVIAGKLQAAGHLNNAATYFIKKHDGSAISEDDTVKSCIENKAIFTTNKDWKPVPGYSEGFHDADEVDDDFVLNDGTYWSLPFLDTVLWNDHAGDSRLFLLENLMLYDSAQIRIRLLVQYSQLNSPIGNGINSAVKSNKMLQVLTNIVNNELSLNHLTIGTLYNKIDELQARMKQLLSMFTEQNWNIKIDVVSLLGVDIENG